MTLIIKSKNFIYQLAVNLILNVNLKFYKSGGGGEVAVKDELFMEELFRQKCSKSKFEGEIALQEGNYSGVIIQRAKVRRVIFLGRNL